MKIRYQILFLILFQSLISFGQVPNWSWVKDLNGTNNEYDPSVATDISGNIYLTGDFNSSILLIDTTTLTNIGVWDIFLVKYNSNGNVIWAKSAGGGDADYAKSIAVDSSGNIYVTGYFKGSNITFDSITLINTNTNWYDIFLAKYDKNGNILWAKSIGGLGDDEAFSVSVDASVNVFIVGAFKSAILSFDTINLTNTNIGYDDFFIAKYDSNGNVLWAKSMGGTDNDEAYSVAVDDSGSAYITGAYNSSIITIGSTTFTNAGIGDIFLVKFNTSGSVIWVKSIGGNNNDGAHSVAVSVSGNVYLTGTFYSTTLTFDSIHLTNAGNGNIFLAKYNSNGNVIWAKSAGGPNYDFSYSVAVDALENSYLTGWFSSSSINFGTTTLINKGYDDIFIAKYDTYGNVQWAKSAGGTNHDYAFSVAIDTSSNIFLTGVYYSPMISFDTTTLTNAGYYDVFIGKLNNDILTGLIDLNYALNIIIFPNPTNNVFVIKVPPTTRQIKILNSTGQLVQKRIVDRQTNYNFTLKDSGIYFIQVITDKESLTKKLIVTN